MFSAPVVALSILQGALPLTPIRYAHSPLPQGEREIEGFLAQGDGSRSGHTLSYSLQPSTVRYKFRGQVLTTYVGAVSAPGSRQADFSGVYTVVTQQRGSKWVVLGLTKELTVTKSGKALSEDEARLAMGGIWTQIIGGEAFYTVRGQAARPYEINSPLWPIAWMPLTPENSLKIGDEFTQTFLFPAQAFLEDDPIARIPLAIKYVFDGPEYPASSGLFGISIKTEADIDQPVKHPEDPNLTLKGKILVDGRLKVDRYDGRLNYASVIMSVELGLEGKKYPFGFSKAKGSVTANFERIK